MDDEQEAELRNPFPSPPSHYLNYTSHNLHLLTLYKTRIATNGGSETDQQELVLADQKDVPEWPLIQLEKPRVDWILEDGHYSVFGDTWFVKENIPSLGELGGHQLYPPDPSIDRRPALLSILRSLLVTYSSLLTSLLSPPPTASATAPPEWQNHVEWMTVMGQNIMSAANDLRPVQARVNLETMMKRQLELRRVETKAIQEKCSTLERRLSELQSSAAQIGFVSPLATTTMEVPSLELKLLQTDRRENSSSASITAVPDVPIATIQDVLCWAEDI